MPRRLCLALLTLTLACGDDDGPAGPAGDGGTPDGGGAPTYHQDVAPIVARHCLTCHVEGGIGPFPLDTFEGVREVGPQARLAVSRRQMPPWMPDPECGDLANERLLTDDEIEVFTAWVRGGMLRGDPATATPIEPTDPPIFTPTHTAAAPSYTPNADLPDDYRCFVLDFEFTEDSYLTASTVVPDASALVHHVLVYALGPEDVAAAEALDAAEEGPGYTCFGGPLPMEGGMSAASSSSLPTQLGAWVPGLLPAIYPEGVGIPIRAGSRVVMQLHYNLLSAEPVPDATQFAMRLTTTPVTQAIDTHPLPKLDLAIPPGEASAVQTQFFRNSRSTPMTIQGLTGHMHLLGKSIRGQVVRADGTEECGLHIPDWDFNWQQSYTLATPIVLQPGDGIRLTCEYDNSDDNQPVVNGMQLEPRAVVWGEGTLDEMCLMYISETRPLEDTVPQDCATATSACFAACDTADLECLWNCEGLELSCARCQLEASLNCLQGGCISQLLAARSCLQECALSSIVMEGSMGRCLEATCPTQWEALTTCSQGVFDVGTCDERLSACGIVRPTE
ncbi:MAG: monooxygenase [Polyangiales bacterium]